MMKINPTGEIPSLVTDTGLALSESIAICKGLDDLQGARACSV